jgi:hypothetical protein
MLLKKYIGDTKEADVQVLIQQTDEVYKVHSTAAPYSSTISAAKSAKRSILESLAIETHAIEIAGFCLLN